MAGASRRGVPADANDLSFETAFDHFLRSGDRSTLVDYLLLRSNLPGPRGNLELVHRFADTVTANGLERGEQVLELCVTFINGTPPAASVGNPMEFIPVCGLVGLGGLGSVRIGAKYPYYHKAIDRLKGSARDPRWRVREGVAMGLQRIIAARPKPALRSLSGWVAAGDWSEMRAVAAGVAEPPLLKDPVVAQESLRLHRNIMDHVLYALTQPSNGSGSRSTGSEAFQKLTQCLEYSLSVVVAAQPEDGFAYLDELASSLPPNGGKYSAGAILHRLLKENLKKNRLKRYFPEHVENVMTYLQ